VEYNGHWKTERRVYTPSDQPGVSRVWVERQGAIESRRRQRRLADQEKQRPGTPANRFGVIALGFERLSGQATGFADVREARLMIWS
jgi:hypothetical protein